MKILLACECSGRTRQALAAKGHDVWSVDLLPAEDNSPYHIMGDALQVARQHDWDMLIGHPPCTYLANSGVRWLRKTSSGMLDVTDQRFKDMVAGAQFFADLLALPIPKIALENPIMHKHARDAIWLNLNAHHKIDNLPPAHYVQPWWFGDPYFKATGFTLKGLPPLMPTNRLTPPKHGTDEYKAWSMIHRMSPGKDRAKNRSRTFPGLAKAIAEQWG